MNKLKDIERNYLQKIDRLTKMNRKFSNIVYIRRNITLFYITQHGFFSIILYCCRKSQMHNYLDIANRPEEIWHVFRFFRIAKRNVLSW